MNGPHGAATALPPEEVVWHDVECGGFGADLSLWESLAAQHPGPVLELGCGTGRVALRLAGRGYDVTAVERTPALADAARARARVMGLPLEIHDQEIERMRLDGRFALVIAPMQVLQLLDGAGVRRSAFAAIARHLSPGGVAAAAIVEGDEAASPDPSPAVPDVRERDGWIYSSLPLEVRAVAGRLVIRRLRQIVSPEGELSEAVDEVRLSVLDAGTLEAEAAGAGLEAADRLQIEPSEDHVGSTVVLLRHPGAS